MAGFFCNSSGKTIFLLSPAGPRAAGLLPTLAEGKVAFHCSRTPLGCLRHCRPDLLKKAGVFDLVIPSQQQHLAGDLGGLGIIVGEAAACDPLLDLFRLQHRLRSRKKRETDKCHTAVGLEIHNGVKIRVFHLVDHDEIKAVDKGFERRRDRGLNIDLPRREDAWGRGPRG
jgi:hypothetical protein